ncbi:MAG: hypothetical protein KGH98_04120 [Candidatus Micrarchaeota archaeon]|nr:hypothetical protein [Candidatus Micrarchaeota archaeon]
MNVRIVSDTENRLFGRRDIEFDIVSESATVSKEEAKVELCKKLSLDPDATVIVRVDQQFGYKRCVGFAHSYKNAADIKRYEPEHLLGRGKKGAAAEQPKEEPKQEKREEKKEEKKE